MSGQVSRGSAGEYQADDQADVAGLSWQVQSAKTRLGAAVAQIMNSLLQNSDLKKVGKTTRPFMYDLNQIPYDYTVEVKNRFKRLHLIDRVPEELWMEVCDIVQEAVIKTIPKKKKCKKAKQLYEEAL